MDADRRRRQADLAALGQAVRERQARNTVVRWLRWSVLAAALLAACTGGGKRNDTYAKGTDAQAQCCENLTGSERDACLGQIVRTEDPQAAKTATNQATYACVVENFVCDPHTGHSTAASAQAQYDCIEDQTR